MKTFIAVIFLFSLSLCFAQSNLDTLFGYEDLIKEDGTKKSSSEVFAGKDLICIYFGAYWLPPCRAFTPVLKEFYEVLYYYT